MKYEKLTEEQKSVTSCSNCPYIPCDSVKCRACVNQLLSWRKEIIDQLENGILKYIPYNIGDTVYVIRKFTAEDYSKHKDVSSGKVTGISFNINNKLYITVCSIGDTLKYPWSLNGQQTSNYTLESVFHSQEEAEKHLSMR